MTLQTENINGLSAADIVAAINALAERRSAGEDVLKAICHALEMLDHTRCRTIGDATALLGIVHFILQDLGSREAGEAEAFRSELAGTAIRYQLEAIGFLMGMDLHLQAEELRGGSTIN